MMSSRTTGPILATGLATIANQSVFQNEPMDWRVPIATAFAAVGFNMVERVWADGAMIFAWSTFITVMIVRVKPGVPSPVESAVAWWNKSTKG